MAVSLVDDVQRWIGLNADKSGITPTKAGSTFYETDTGKHFVWNGSWLEYVPSLYTGTILPQADNTYDLGSAALSYRNAHIETAVYATSVVGNWSPSAASTYTLGTTSLEWQGLYLGSDAGLFMGLAQTVVFVVETADANAVELVIELPAGGATNVPVIAIGQSIVGVDLGLYDGVVDPVLAMFGVGAVATAPVIEGRKSRGTVGTPTAITATDELLNIRGYGYGGASGYVLAAEIRMLHTGTVADTRVGGQIEFWTATDAAPSVLTRRGYISPGGTMQWLGQFNAASVGWTTDIVAQADAASITAWQADGKYFILRARDTGVGNVEVARVAGAADPYFGIGVDGSALKGTYGGLLGFFGATPIAQLAKASYNNWAAFTDVVDALVAIGLIDAA